MTEADVVQSVADGGGTAVWGAIAVILWKIYLAIAEMAKSSSEALTQAKTNALRAEKHYEVEEEMFRALREANGATGIRLAWLEDRLGKPYAREGTG